MREIDADKVAPLPGGYTHHEDGSTSRIDAFNLQRGVYDEGEHALVVVSQMNGSTVALDRRAVVGHLHRRGHLDAYRAACDREAWTEFDAADPETWPKTPHGSPHQHQPWRHSGPLLVCHEGQRMQATFAIHDDGHARWARPTGATLDGVTHWRDLPAGPEGVGDVG